MIVFDASTLILLARIDLLESFLAGCGMEVKIPNEVEADCCEVKKTFDALLIRKVIDERKIQMVHVKDQKFVAKLRGDFSLGKGETEAIVLASQVNAKLAAIDDKNGINACKLLGLAFTTAPGILVFCCEKKLISAKDAHTKLALVARFGPCGPDWRPKNDEDNEHPHGSAEL